MRDHTPAQNSSPASRVTPQSSHEDSGSSIEDVSPVNMMHVELLHHVSSELKAVFEADFEHVQIPFPIVIGYCLSAPYLMNEVLALSALHLSIIRAKQQQLYRYRASHLQQHALSIFNAMKPEANTESCIPLFLFSSLLGTYLLCDTLVFREGPFDTVLDNFTQYIRLHQGVRAVTNGCWEFLLQTELAPILDVDISIPEASSDLSHDLQNLAKLIDSAELGESTTKTYNHAIRLLQGVMTTAVSHSSWRGKSRAAFAWPVIVETDYIDLISCRQPEGLVILAYYAVLLHMCRDYWVFGDGGRYLIESISQYLGPAWESWLVWPNRCLQEDAL